MPQPTEALDVESSVRRAVACGGGSRGLVGAMPKRRRLTSGHARGGREETGEGHYSQVSGVGIDTGADSTVIPQGESATFPRATQREA